MKIELISALLRSVFLFVAFVIVLPLNLQAAQQGSDQSPAADEMVLIVNVSALVADGPHSDVLVPIINVRASLLNPQETVVWQETGHNTRNRNTSPEQLRAAWTKISDLVGRMLVKELSQKR